MKKNFNKNNLFILIIAIVSIISSFLFTTQVALTLFLVLFLYYLIITKRYMFKVFKGTKAYKLEDYSKALEYYRDAAMSPWCSAPIVSNYLICELKHGRASLANEYINENLNCERFKPNDRLDLDTTKTVVMWKNGDHEEAIELLEALLKNNKTTYLYETLTSLLLCCQRFTEANKYLSEAMKFNDTSTILKSNYAEINYKLGKFDESKETFNSLVKENIHFIEPYYYSALIEKDNGNYEKAIELLRIAESLNDSLVSLLSHKDVEQALNLVLVKSLNN